MPRDAESERLTRAAAKPGPSRPCTRESTSAAIAQLEFIVRKRS
jgi:hypothetical protein